MWWDVLLRIILIIFCQLLRSPDCLLILEAKMFGFNRKDYLQFFNEHLTLASSKGRHSYSAFRGQTHILTLFGGQTELIACSQIPK